MTKALELLKELRHNDRISAEEFGCSLDSDDEYQAKLTEAIEELEATQNKACETCKWGNEWSHCEECYLNYVGYYDKWEALK